jgi:hypothetical protein
VCYHQNSLLIGKPLCSVCLPFVSSFRLRQKKNKYASHRLGAKAEKKNKEKRESVSDLQQKRKHLFDRR